MYSVHLIDVCLPLFRDMGPSVTVDFVSTDPNFFKTMASALMDFNELPSHAPLLHLLEVSRGMVRGVGVSGRAVKTKGLDQVLVDFESLGASGSCHCCTYVLSLIHI